MALNDARRPRHLLRRFCAFAVDVAIAWLIVLIGMSIVLDDPVVGKLDRETKTFRLGVGLESGSFKPPVYIASHTCGYPVDLLPMLREYVSPAKIIGAEACFDRNNGMPVGGSATLTFANTAKAGDLAGRVVNVPLTLDTGHRYGDALAFLTFLAASILGLKLFGTTPGKKMMGLRVVGAAPIPAFRRELIRSLPHLLTIPTFLAINMALRPLPSVLPVVQVVAISLELLSILAVLVLWVNPAVRWRGAFLHDRWLGLAVVVVRDLAVGTPPAD